MRTLRQLKQLPVDLIVPGHGPAMDKEIIDANERYIEGRLRGGRARPRQTGVAAARAGPAGGGVPAAEGVDVDDVYAEAHRENLVWAWDEV